MAESRKAYPVSNEPLHQSYINVGDGHQLYVEEYGDPQGIPALVCHGGPGAGCQPAHAGFFDPQRYRIILLDQRGAGKSLPKGECRDNNTERLVQDIDVVRQALQINAWVVYGGSWGTTLAVLYAQSYPQQVLSLVLRGVFLGRAQDTACFLGANTWAAQQRPAAWHEFSMTIHEMLRLQGLPASDDYIAATLSLLQQPDVAVQERAAAALAKWEYYVSFRAPEPMPQDFTLGGAAMARIELVYLQNNCFLAPNQLLDNLARLPKVPIHIIQGSQDYICPHQQAELLTMRLKALDYKVDYTLTPAGHAGTEPENMTAILTALDAVATQVAAEAAALATASKYCNNLFSPPRFARVDTTFPAVAFPAQTTPRG